MYWLDEFIFDQNTDRVCFMMDSDQDIESLPTSKTPGVEQAGGNVSNEPVALGSLAYSIDSGSRFMLNSADVWKKLKNPGGGGGGGASALTDLTDVSISNLQNNQVIAWDETQQMFINKTMEQVVHVDYSNIDNAPTINGVPLTENTTLQDLGIATVDEPHETVSFGDGD